MRRRPGQALSSERGYLDRPMMVTIYAGEVQRTGQVRQALHYNLQKQEEGGEGERGGVGRVQWNQTAYKRLFDEGDVDRGPRKVLTAPTEVTKVQASFIHLLPWEENWGFEKKQKMGTSNN